MLYRKTFLILVEKTPFELLFTFGVCHHYDYCWIPIRFIRIVQFSLILRNGFTHPITRSNFKYHLEFLKNNRLTTFFLTSPSNLLRWTCFSTFYGCLLIHPGPSVICWFQIWSIVYLIESLNPQNHIELFGLGGIKLYFTEQHKLFFEFHRV